MESLETLRLKICTVNDIHSFVHLATKNNICGYVHSVGNYKHCVPVTSILGMFSLNLLDDLIVEFKTDKDNEENRDRFVMGCKQWIVD